jgi:hypothetical protein
VGKIIYRDIPFVIQTAWKQIYFEISDDVIYKTKNLCRDRNTICTYEEIIKRTVDRKLMQHKDLIVKHFQMNSKCFYPRVEITLDDIKLVLMMQVFDHSI